MERQVDTGRGDAMEPGKLSREGRCDAMKQTRSGDAMRCDSGTHSGDAGRGDAMRGEGMQGTSEELWFQ